MPQRDVVQALTALEPKTKAAKVREVMPLIEQRISAGVRIVDVLRALRANGIDLTEATLKSYLYRYRQKQQVEQDSAGQKLPANVQQPHVQQSSATEAVSQRHYSDSSSISDSDLSTHASPHGPPHEPMSMQELDRLMKPDPDEQAEKLARYERLAKQQRRSRK
ncbi:conjugal transfer protein TraD [Caballeronia sp. LZ065]|uniref:conjugal transfer protein TraD n=1 Tax=Caballeronia sp. LZ065 TaxID=3038571 RepID=UPI002854BB34|nr:conjugal transfer protein TraD [Caballeronia sp. LZ065]MDR5784571.1 conjugal transfer protein TraD [Caballeronia sp. LZ065]